MKKHFKTLAMVMVCMAMALCVSCKKDKDEPSGGGNGGGGNTGGGGGSQTVEMRLSKISIDNVTYHEYSTDGGQTWNISDFMDTLHSGCTYIFTWNDKILSNVNLGRDSSSSIDNCDFHYDNNRLSYAIIEDFYEDVLMCTERVDVTYDGGNMSEWTDYREGEIHEVYNLEYSNGKLSRFTFEEGCCNFFWNGDNVSELTYCHSEDVISFSYDDKKNPFYGIDAWRVFSVVRDHFALRDFSKNNLTCIRESDGHTHDVTYTYNDKNYPTQAVQNSIHPSSVGSQRQRNVSTITYEYLD